MKIVFVVLFALVFVVLAPTLVVAVENELERVVTVTILVDGTDDIVEVKPLLDNTLLATRRIFEKEFNIKLKIVDFKFGLWFAPADTFDVDEELKKMANNFPRRSDIVVVFTTKGLLADAGQGVDDNSETIPIKKSVGGSVDDIMGHYVIVKIQKYGEIILLHELGHLFGAEHSLSPDSIMCAEEISTSHFDQKSLEVILSNKNRSF